MRDGTNEIMMELAMNCMQLACALIYYRVPPVDVFEAIQKDSLLVPVKELIIKANIAYQSLNFFEETINNIKDLEDIMFLYKGIEKIFENSLESLYSQNLFKETITLLLKVAKTHPTAINELYLYGYDFNFLFVIACHHISHYSTKEGTGFFVYLNLSLLHQFCFYKEFAVGMNKDCKVISGANLAYIEAAFSDCFIIFVRDTALNSNIKLQELTPTLLGMLANM
jgi:hypothetical protein